MEDKGGDGVQMHPKRECTQTAGGGHGASRSTLPEGLSDQDYPARAFDWLIAARQTELGAIKSRKNAISVPNRAYVNKNWMVSPSTSQNDAALQ